jgi:energy-coupling factor transporter ATP-binding protein EcfA2
MELFVTASLTKQVYFKRLTLSNVRSFGDEQHLDMCDGDGRPARWTLILGENGVGKTTILQCLASMCPVPAVSAPVRSANVGEINTTLTAPEPTGVEPALLRREDSELVALARSGEEIVTLRVELVSGNALETASHHPSDFSLEASVIVKDGDLIDVKQTFVEIEHPVEPLIIGYSAARHMRYGRGETLAPHPDGTASLFDPSIELADAKDILEQLDYAAAKQQPGAKDLLDRIKDALAKLLPDVESASSIILYGPSQPRERGQKSGVQVKTPYGEVPLEALSLGYQTMTAWAVDLAWRLYQRYPKAAEPLHEPAIVLIDELDLHLHPRWQRKLRESISAAFPQVQFIATAHSPLLAQSYLGMNLAVVREENGQAVIENDPSVVKTWRIDEVVTSALYEIGSAFSPEVTSDLQDRTKLKQKRRLTSAEKKRLVVLDKLASELAPTFSSEDQRALDIIQRAAQLFDSSEK